MVDLAVVIIAVDVTGLKDMVLREDEGLKRWSLKWLLYKRMIKKAADKLGLNVCFVKLKNKLR